MSLEILFELEVYLNHLGHSPHQFPKLIWALRNRKIRQEEARTLYIEFQSVKNENIENKDIDVMILFCVFENIIVERFFFKVM